MGIVNSQAHDAKGKGHWRPLGLFPLHSIAHPPSLRQALCSQFLHYGADGGGNQQLRNCHTIDENLYGIHKLPVFNAVFQTSEATIFVSPAGQREDLPNPATLEMPVEPPLNAQS